MTKKTSFELVSAMNIAFGNPKGEPTNINWERVRAQFKNIGDEYAELLEALGASQASVDAIRGINAMIKFDREPDLEGVRDASRDVVVFADGGHHLMGIDGDRDMASVINGVMTRFVKDEHDLLATKEKHLNKGVVVVYTEGNYPTMILKSGTDQPDAPKDKFLKSASYAEPVFYDINETK